MHIQKKRHKLTIGWSERVDLPEWGIRGIRAKADTGARSSSLHVVNLVELPNQQVRFDVVVSKTRRRHIVATVSRMGHVRSSTGEGTTRFFVQTRLRLGSLEREVEVNLVNREHMMFRMLLGRTALSGILVDPSRRRLLAKEHRHASRP